MKHFLPTDLLLETTTASSTTARVRKATVRHAESVNPIVFSTDEGEQGRNGLGSQLFHEVEVTSKTLCRFVEKSSVGKLLN